MANKGCLLCGGEGWLSGHKNPCPNCNKGGIVHYYSTKVPKQYQGMEFNVAELPSDMQNVYGPWMQNMMERITSDPASFQQNFVIASRVNSGKTVWSYTLINKLSELGFNTPGVVDIADIRDEFHNNHTGDFSANEKFTSRCLIVKLPRMLDSWCYDMMSFIIDKRVRNDGFTIFLYPGSSSDMELQDKFKHLPPMIGDGRFNTVHIYSFFS